MGSDGGWGCDGGCEGFVVRFVMIAVVRVGTRAVLGAAAGEVAISMMSTPRTGAKARTEVTLILAVARACKIACGSSNR